MPLPLGVVSRWAHRWLGDSVRAPGIVIAAPASGAGKTTVALALIAAARRRGLVVQPCKVGPDFIDPSHLARAAGRSARTLDGWMLGREACIDSFASATGEADLAVVEGMMGLFDGVTGDSDAGSTAQIAKWLDLPVLLVVDAGAMARSVAALVRGFRDFDRDLRVTAVVFNRLGGAGHLRFLEDALASAELPPCLGGLPADCKLALPERHLGLVPAAELEAPFDRLADAAERHFDLERILTIARSAREHGRASGVDAAAGDMGHAAADPADASVRHRADVTLPRRADAGIARRAGPRAGPHVTIAIARDEAFSFYYPENLELLERAGAALIEFSPLRDGALPAGVHGIYLGGGYPELYAERLAANRILLEDLRRFAAAGGLVYAECGGLMVLGAALVDQRGRAHCMAQVFPFRTRMLERGMTLGYREIEIAPDGFLPPLVARGHEFHHSSLEMDTVPESIARLYSVRDPVRGEIAREGFTIGRTLASYVHVHFASAPALASALVAAARDASRSRAEEQSFEREAR